MNIGHFNRPAALRTSIHGQQYAALLFQALDAIPQVRETYLKYEPLVLTSPPGSDPEFEASEEYRIGSGELSDSLPVLTRSDCLRRLDGDTGDICSYGYDPANLSVHRRELAQVSFAYG